jgi:hypothetical protein
MIGATVYKKAKDYSGLGCQSVYLEAYSEARGNYLYTAQSFRFFFFF